MPASYHRLLVALTVSVSLLLGACAAKPTIQSDASVAQLPQAAPQEASLPEGSMDTDSTIWTLLGIAKKPKPELGPVTGAGVSPVLWQAVLDTLSFAKIDSMDPVAGLAITEWYTPHGKPDERVRVTAFVKARALRSDSIVVTVERQTRAGNGGWQDATISADVANNLENDILERARQIHIARLRQEQ